MIEYLSSYKHIKYEDINICKLLDKGNVSVYKGTYLDKHVAIKKYKYTEDNIDTIMTELEISHKFNSERIMKTYGYSYNKDKTLLYLVMEYINSKDLYTYLEQDKYHIYLDEIVGRDNYPYFDERYSCFFTMSRKTKPIWEILCLKNENEVKKIKLIFDQVRLKKDQALARKLKLETMLEEYSHKFQEVLKTPKTKHQPSDYRQFIVQVQKLLVFANDDVVKLTESFETVNRKLIEAQNEKLKLEKLAEKQAAKVVHREEKLNAKERDAMNILKYNRNN